MCGGGKAGRPSLTPRHPWRLALRDIVSQRNQRHCHVPDNRTLPLMHAHVLPHGVANPYRTRNPIRKRPAAEIRPRRPLRCVGWMQGPAGSNFRSSTGMGRDQAILYEVGSPPSQASCHVAEASMPPLLPTSAPSSFFPEGGKPHDPPPEKKKTPLHFWQVDMK